MGPVATGLGEVYHYILTSDVYDLTELRSLQDWVVRPRLRRVPGRGRGQPLGRAGQAVRGHAPIPMKLAKYNLTLDDVIRALEENNKNVGGGYVVRADESSLVQGVGRARSVEEIAKIVITARDGVPIRVGDVAEVGVGHAIRRGGVTANGKGEVVLGLAFMRMGENSRDVTMALDQAMQDVRKALPPGRRDRRSSTSGPHLVDQVLHTVERNLFEGAVLVIAVLFAFLGNFRAGLIVASAIPLSMLFAVTMMERVGIAGSLMSLGAIDFGLVVDSSVVMVENCVRHLAHDRTGREEAGHHPRRGRRGPQADDVRRADHHDRLPADPDLARDRGEAVPADGPDGHLCPGRVDGPVADPDARPGFARPAPEDVRDRRRSSTGSPTGSSSRCSTWACGFPGRRSFLVGAITVATTILGLSLGSEFVPRLGEGTIVINTIRLASVSLEESLEYGTQIEAILKEEFPDEIDQIWSRTGTAEVATDPMGFEVTDVFITLKPRERWKKAKTQDELVEAMSEVTEKLPGMRAVYSQPIEMRINEMVAGIRADLGIKLFGDDLEVLKAEGRRDRAGGQSNPRRGRRQHRADHRAARASHRGRSRRPGPLRHPGPAGARRRQGGGGIKVGEVLEPDRRFPLVVRLPMSYRDDPRALEKILIPTASGQRLAPDTAGPCRGDDRPLDDPARVGPAADRRPGQRPGPRHRLVRRGGPGEDRPPGATCPPATTIEWGGQFENMQRAERRLLIVVPLALALILSLLYLTFHSFRDALMIFSGVLFARVGGVFGSVVAGHAVHDLGGRRLRRPGRGFDARGPGPGQLHPRPDGARRPEARGDRAGAAGAAAAGADDRHGGGARVRADDALDGHRRRGPAPLATVVFFGMVCDTFLTMLALPVLYLLFGKEPRQSPVILAEGHPQITDSMQDRHAEQVQFIEA